MKINFTKQEFQTLVEMLLVADWVINAHEVEPHAATTPYRKLRKKVLSHHKEMGMAEAFQYSAEHDDYFETADYEDQALHMQFIDAHDEAMFWAGLARRLAHRDLDAAEALRAEGPYAGEERAMKLFEIEARYEEEFAENGLDNIRVVGDGPRIH